MYKKLILITLLLSSLVFAETQDTVIRVGACETPGITWGVFVQDSFAYVADRSNLTVVDISVLTIPSVVGSLFDIDVRPKGIYVADTVVYHNNGVNATFSTASIADPTAPYKLGWCFRANPMIEPKGVFVIDSIVYLAAGNKGLYLINTSNPSMPFVIDSFDTPGVAYDIFAKDTLVYIADYDSLQIINVAIPTSMYRTGAVFMPNKCYDVFVVDTFAYVVCQSSFGTDGSLQVVNVSNPELPQIVTSVNPMNGDPFDLWISGNYAYIAAADYWNLPKGAERQVGGLRPEWTFGKRADVEGGLRVVDISNPLNPELVASYDTPGDPRGVFAIDTLVFIADYDSLQILRHSVTGIAEADPGPYVGGIGLQIHPNPSVTYAVIKFNLPEPTHINIKIFDVSGRLIKTLYIGHKESGTYSIPWNRIDNNMQKVPNGIYFCHLKTTSGSLIEKLIITK